MFMKHFGGITHLPRGLSKASCFVKPVISAVLLFHSLTLPLMSIPKIGALALVMIVERTNKMDEKQVVIPFKSRCLPYLKKVMTVDNATC